MHYATGGRHNMWVIYLLGKGLSYLSAFCEINVLAQKYICMYKTIPLFLAIGHLDECFAIANIECH